MYIKWIVCEVPIAKKKQFTIAQEKWKRTAESDGFIAQIGGWDLKNVNEAHIIVFWKNKNSLLYFMEHLHDTIFLDNHQNTTYSSITINYFNSLMDMVGELKNIFETIPNSKFIRIADCIVKNNKTNHFEEVQKSIWIPSMKKVTGMLSGKFSINEQNKLNYLVHTFWDSKKHHQNYVQNQLPLNQKNANITSDLDSISGKFIEIENKWTVFKNP
jgi:heme-degrading monooxygenase HmoA